MHPWFRLALPALVLAWPLTAARAQTPERINIDAHAPTTPFPHFWEQIFGSGRANLSLRQSYRDDIRSVQKVADFRYVRFHAILHDENGVYTEDEHGNPVYNFSYVDQIYDGLLANGVRPVVEISFMPKKLAFNPDALHPFWYKQNVSPPKSLDRWDGLMAAFAQHLVDRYGIDEVSQWYFEVWNEPNIDFWNGIPRLESYLELYDHTARDLKKINPRLRVGGPATAAASWIPEFLAHTAANHVPVDFVSTHAYADDTVENLFPGSHENIPEDDRVCRAVAKVRHQIDASPTHHLPLLWTEWNVIGSNNARDTTYVGPALADTIRACDGNVTEMSFWTFDDVFEEGGPEPAPFIGAFGLIAKGGIYKPSYYQFGLLHQLGDQRIASDAKNLIITKSPDGTLTIAAWNLVDPGEHGAPQTLDLALRNVPANAHVSIQRVDDDHGNVLPKYSAMGSPVDPTPAQVIQLNQETALPPPSQTQLHDGKLTLELTPNALLLIKVLP
jgi:xylan 1,4-beta-xylosidase